MYVSDSYLQILKVVCALIEKYQGGKQNHTFILSDTVRCFKKSSQILRLAGNMEINNKCYIFTILSRQFF